MNSIQSYNDSSFTSMMHSKSDNGTNDLLQDNYGATLDGYYHSSLPLHIQDSWMHSDSSLSSVSTPENSPSTPSPHLANSTINDCFPQHWPTGPTQADPTQSIKEIQRLSQAKSRRRQQNRESQRAFRERKNKHIEQLETALADLQHRHEKLLQCFVGLTAKVSSSPSLGGNGMSDMSFLDEQPIYSSQERFNGRLDKETNFRVVGIDSLVS